MRRHIILLVGLLLLVASCTDSTQPTRSLITGPPARYQLSQSGTLSEEIHSLIAALFPQGLETAAGTRWEHVEARVAGGDLVKARKLLLELALWIVSKRGQMDTPPHGESREAASARLILYMSLYVYSGPNTPPPSSFGSGADAVVAIVAPDAETTVQTPREHAGARFDAGTVGEPTIVVISQNTEFYPAHCSGPFTTKYCQYPLYYHYRSFPTQRFLKPVHLAVCTVETGKDYGALPGQDHDSFVLAHDKPADSTHYTPGGYPVPGESIELLPRNPNYNPTRSLTHCHDTAYPQVSTTAYAPASGVVGTALAHAARGVNRAVTALTAVLTPTLAYAVDNGAETDTYTFSDFAHVDTTGRPDLSVSQTSASASSVQAGDSVTLTYTVGNIGTAPSPAVLTAVQLVGSPPATAVTLAVTSATGNSGGLFPLDSRVQTVTVTIPSSTPAGSYSIAPVVSSSGGLPEDSLANNRRSVSLQVTSVAPPAPSYGRYGTATVDGTFASGEWDDARCAPLAVSIPGGGTSAGTLCWQNDHTNMFFGLSFPSSIDIIQANFSVEFDRDSSSSMSVGDDVIVANRQLGFSDNVRVPCQINHDVFCAPADSTVGGTSDGMRGWTYANGRLTAEMSHPLNSGDTHDLALTAGSAVGISAHVRLIIQNTLTDTRYPASGYAAMQTYTAPMPTGPFFTRTATGAASETRRAPRRAVLKPAGRPLRERLPAGMRTP